MPGHRRHNAFGAVSVTFSGKRFSVVVKLLSRLRSECTCIVTCLSRIDNGGVHRGVCQRAVAVGRACSGAFSRPFGLLFAQVVAEVRSRFAPQVVRVVFTGGRRSPASVGAAPVAMRNDFGSLPRLWMIVADGVRMLHVIWD